MEKKEILEWREHLIKMFGIYHSDKARHTDCPLCGVNLEKISDYMIQELDKAREEGKLEVLEELLEWDTPLEPIGKFMRLQTKMVEMKRDLLNLLKTKEDEK